MKKIMIVLLLLLVTACQSGSPSGYDGEGYILEVADSRVLVLDKKYSETTWREIQDEYEGGAIWISTKNADLKPGQKIRYWIEGGIDGSYPAQASARKIEVIE